MRRTAIWPWSEALSWEWVPVDHRHGGADSPRGGLRRRILVSHLDRGDSGPSERKREFRRVTIAGSGTPKRTGESVDGKLQGKRSGTGAQSAPRHQKQARRRGFLEAGMARGPALCCSAGNPCWHRPRPNLADVQNGPMANLGRQLINVYEAFSERRASAAALAAQVPRSRVQGKLGPDRV